MVAYIRKTDGGRVKVAGVGAVVAVGATTTVVVAEDPDREVVILTNASDEAIDVTIGAAAVANQGVRLQPGVDTNPLILTAETGAMMAINAICASGSKNLAVQTITRA